jgi:hypothetical protein
VTTPERLRRRQRIEGFVLMLLGVGMLFQQWYFGHQNANTLECIAHNFALSAQAQTARVRLQGQDTALSQHETAASRRNWLIYAHAAGILKKSGMDDLNPHQQKVLQDKFIDSLLDYKRITKHVQEQRDRITAARAKHPVPAFPNGTCT